MAFYSAMPMGGGGMGGGMGGGNFGGMGGNPSAFSNPGMDPMTLALLLRMQSAGMPGQGAGNMAPQIPQAQPPQGGGPPGMMMGGGGGGAQMPAGAAGAPGQSNMMSMLAPLLQNPQMLQGLLSGLKAPGQSPAFPSMGQVAGYNPVQNWWGGR